MNARMFLIGLGVFAFSVTSVACDKLRAPDGDGKATVTAASAEPAAATAPATATATATATAAAPATAAALVQGGKPAVGGATTVINGNRAIRVQNGPNGSVTDFAGPHGSGTVQVAPGGVKVQGPNGTVVVPLGAVPGMPSAGQ